MVNICNAPRLLILYIVWSQPFIDGNFAAEVIVGCQTGIYAEEILAFKEVVRQSKHAIIRFLTDRVFYFLGSDR